MEVFTAPLSERNSLKTKTPILDVVVFRTKNLSAFSQPTDSHLEIKFGALMYPEVIVIYWGHAFSHTHISPAPNAYELYRALPLEWVEFKSP